MSDSSAKSTRPRLNETQRLGINIACVVAILLLTLIGGWRVLALLALGWAPYFWNHVLALSIDWDVAFWWVLGVAILMIGLHALCVWLAQHLGRAESDKAAARWPFRATLKILFALLAMATAGIGMIGVAHQVTWLVHRPGISVSLPLAGHENSSRRTISNNNLRNMDLGEIRYETLHRHLPNSTFSPTGRPLHNWFTVMLPQMDLPTLYDQIDFSKPWNDPVQGEAFDTKLDHVLRPGVYIQEDARGRPVTHYAANKHLFGMQRPTRFAAIKDGASTTIFFGEINDQFPAWGQPLRDRDPGLGLNVPGGFGAQWEGVVLFALGDGSVQAISNQTDPEVMRQLATPAGGEKIPADVW